MRTSSTLLAAALALGASQVGLAQGSASTATDVPDRFRIELGGFRIGSDTQLRLNNGTGGGNDISFERELALPENSTRFFIDGYWRIARRHQLSLSWFHVDRESPGRTLQRDITWGDQVFHVNSQVKAKAASDYFSGVYRFAAYRNDRFEIGPALGFGYLSIDASIETVGAAVAFEQSVSKGQATGDLGAYINWWPIRRLLVRGDFRYIIVKPENAEASISDGRASLTYYVVPKVGVGLQYTYTKFRYDRSILDTDLGGSLRYRGGQVLLSFAF
jgi:hypothetical protein